MTTGHVFRSNPVTIRSPRPVVTSLSRYVPADGDVTHNKSSKSLGSRGLSMFEPVMNAKQPVTQRYLSTSVAPLSTQADTRIQLRDINFITPACVSSYL